MTAETYTTHQLFNNEATPEEFVSAEHSVKHAIQATGMQSVIRSIWLNSPVLETATQRLARMFSHHYPSIDDDRPLLTVAILEAADAYTKSVKEAKRQEDHDMAFMSALHHRMMDFQAHSAIAVYPGDETAMWLPFGHAMIDWVKKVEPERIGFVRKADAVSERTRKAGSLILAAYMLRYERAEDVYSLIEHEHVL